MIKLDLPYVQRFKDRHGKVRYYFRRPGFQRAKLPGEPGSAPFMAAYQLAAIAKHEIGADKVKPGSISALIVAYYGSANFRCLNPKTQRNYRNIFDRFRAKYGEAPVAGLEPRHLRGIMDANADRPGAARSLLKRLRTLMDFAVERGWRNDNPARNVKSPKAPPGGFRAWDDADIASFIERWPAGTREHLALMLLLYTGQRRSDIVRMGRQHVHLGYIRVAQVKGSTGPRPVLLDIPLHPNLKAALDGTPKDNLTFLTTKYGKPFSEAGFTNWFVECAKQAGLPARSSPHGLRKAAARRLAEAGASASQIAAVTGHTTLKEVERYTKSADQKRLAESAMARLRDK